MEDFPWKDIHPREHVLVQQLNSITELDKDVVVSLYQPIIGAPAVSLYLYLLSQTKGGQSKQIQHKTICYMLQFGIQIFYEARTRLEAVGLLKTYRLKADALSQESSQRATYVFDIMAPLSPSMFLYDPIYCGLLVDAVGELAFQELKQNFIVEPTNLSDYSDVSQSFHSIFGKQLHLYTGVKDPIIGSKRATLSVEERPFDWAFFNQLVLGTYITPDLLTAEVKTTIQNLHTLYGVSPLDMREFVLQAHNMASNTIQLNRLYQLVRQAYAKQDLGPSPSALAAPGIEADKNDFLKKQGYSEQTIALMAIFDRENPMDFIRRLKEMKSQQRGTGLQFQVDVSEQKVIEQLVTKYGFSKPVVNVMIHHVLVSLNHDMLTSKYMARVANDWVAKDIQTAQAAMEYLMSRERISEPKGSYRKEKKYAPKPVKTIRLTEKEKEALSAKDTPIADQEWDELMAKLK